MRGVVSLKNIAEKCGLSVSTVSQILNNRPGNFSSRETRERVFRVSKELGYRGSFGYQLLHGQSTRTFALLLSQPLMMCEDYIRELSLNLMNELNSRQYSVYFSPMGYGASENLDAIQNFIVRGVEHFIFLGAPVGVREIENLLLKSRRRFISTSSSFSRYCIVDSQSGVEEIYRYFLGKVGEDFRVMGNSWQRNLAQDNRFLALKSVFPERSDSELERKFWRCREVADISPTVYNDEICRNGEKVMDWILENEPEVRAVFCHVDTAAVGAVHSLLAHGKTIGGDMLVAGFNDDFQIRRSFYPISSVTHDWNRNYAKLIDGALEDDPCQMVLKPLVHIRE